MPTVQELRDRAQALGIDTRDTQSKAELLAAIQEALKLVGPLGTSSSEALARIQPEPEPEPEPPPPPRRRHPHTGATPLLGPLELPDLPDTYNVRHLAVLPKGPTAVVVVWSLSRDDWARSAEHHRAVLRVCGDEGLVHTGLVTWPLGRYFVGALHPDQHVWAEISIGSEVLCTSRRILIPPDRPSRLHHPLLASIDIDRPLSDLPRDLRRGAPVPPPEIPGRATASERAWRRATTAPAVPSEPRPRFADAGPAELLEPERHAELVSSFVHAMTDDERSR